MESSNDETSRSTPPPNVVFIVGDNVGWGDIGCYGGLAPTPETDMPLRPARVARRGVIGTPVASTAAVVGTAAVVSHGVDRRFGP